MKIKIGDVWFEVTESSAPIMIVLNEGDKKNIANMAPEATSYAVFPDNWGTSEEMLAWMGPSPSEDIPEEDEDD